MNKYIHNGCYIVAVCFFITLALTVLASLGWAVVKCLKPMELYAAIGAIIVYCLGLGLLEKASYI